MAFRIRRLAVVTSGAACPGANACIRGVVRAAIHHGWEAWGIRNGYEGLLNGEFVALTSRSVSGVIGHGGTMLGSVLSESLKSPQGLRAAVRNLNEQGIDALVVVGGDGSLRGAQALFESGYPTLGVPATVENDVPGTDVSVGVDTALNTALEAMDRIKDAASPHQHAVLVEMMGEKSGYLTLMAGIAGGAEMVCIPEEPFTLEEVASEVADAYVRGKKHCIIAVAEGATPCARDIANYLGGRREETGFEVRLSILGHIQRGGSPMAYDRFLATRLSGAAVDLLHRGAAGMMVGLVDGEIASSALSEVTASPRGIDEGCYAIAQVLAR